MEEEIPAHDGGGNHRRSQRRLPIVAPKEDTRAGADAQDKQERGHRNPVGVARFGHGYRRVLGHESFRHYTSIINSTGFSRYSLMALTNRAASGPSMRRWSNVRHRGRILRATTSSPSRPSRSCVRPRPRM